MDVANQCDSCAPRLFKTEHFWKFRTFRSKATNGPRSSFSRIQARFVSDQAELVKRPCNHLGASIIVLLEPSGAACMPGGVCPCGLSAGAPPVPVSRGPVGPCGCVTPFMSGGSTVRPVLCGESPGCCGLDCVCADALPAHNARHKTTIAMRIYDSCQLIRTSTNGGGQVFHGKHKGRPSPRL
jgi:hypothetical protein